MSIHAIDACFRLDLEPIRKWILVCLADNADHYGGSIFPTIASLSQKTGIPERTLQRHLKNLLTDAYIEVVRGPVRPRDGKPGRGTEYKLSFMTGSFPSAPKPNYSKCPAKLREEVIEIFNRTCSYCFTVGDDLNGPDGRPWHIDRLLPGRRGGAYSPENITLSCGTCNISKGAKLAPEGVMDLGAKRAEMGAKEFDTGATATAPDPSKEPSDKKEPSSRAAPSPNRKQKPKPYPRKNEWPRYVAIYFSITNHAPLQQVWPLIEQRMGAAPDAAKLRECYVAWLARGFNPMAVNWLDWYVDGIPARPNASGGHKAPEPRGAQLRRPANWKELGIAKGDPNFKWNGDE